MSQLFHDENYKQVTPVSRLRSVFQSVLHLVLAVSFKVRVRVRVMNWFRVIDSIRDIGRQLRKRHDWDRFRLGQSINAINGTAVIRQKWKF